MNDIHVHFKLGELELAPINLPTHKYKSEKDSIEELVALKNILDQENVNLAFGKGYSEDHGPIEIIVLEDPDEQIDIKAIPHILCSIKYYGKEIRSWIKDTSYMLISSPPDEEAVTKFCKRQMEKG